MKKILDIISNPSSVNHLNEEELESLVAECRERIIDITSKKGGHLASSLGTVELTVALLKVFNLDKDKIIWDVGHQCYSYKILTGRNKSMELLAEKGKTAKFLRREESEYDHFGAGHASTSISAALGIASGRDANQEDYKVVSVIGDGAMTGGLAFEGLNNAGHLKKNMIVILNDNEMSIDPNVGALSKTIMNIQASKPYNMVRDELAKLDENGTLSKLVRKFFKRSEMSFLTFFTPGGFFEKFDFRYFGPVDGHNVKDLLNSLEQVKDLKGPILLHVLTKKGKGYKFAEGDSFKYHGVSAFQPSDGKMFSKKKQGKSYTSVWSAAIHKFIRDDKKVAAISAAMIGNTGLKPIQEEFPAQVYDVGIAEGHAVTFSGGLATQGVKPFVTIYSTFLQRAFDHIIHDVALQNLPVRFILDRAGFVGADGATHHGVFDLSYLRMIPNMVVMSPKDGVELQQMIRTMYEYNQGPIALRFPRGETDEYDDKEKTQKSIPIGVGEVISEGEDICLIAVGSMVRRAEKVAEMLNEKGVSVTVVNARFIKPLDESLILRLVQNHTLTATLEENVAKGGFGSGVVELLHESDLYKPVKIFGIPDKFIEFGKPEEQLEEAGLTAIKITTSLLSTLEKINQNHLSEV